MKKNNFQSPVLETDTIETLSEKLLQSNLHLVEANRELNRLQKERSEMLANISHDLRAPITAIRSAIDLMKSAPEPDPERFREMLAMIDRRTSVLETLIHDMHEMFSLENSGNSLQFEALPALPFLEECFFDITLNSLFDDKETILDIPESLQATVCVDISKLIRVLENLLTNAAKYAGPGATITLRARVTDAEPYMLCLEVTDNGIGIPAESLPHIFDRTYTVSRARTPDGSTGSGLGLCIAKTIIERFGGTITCESTPGQITVFRILLPLIE